MKNIFLCVHLCWPGCRQNEHNQNACRQLGGNRGSRYRKAMFKGFFFNRDGELYVLGLRE